MYNISISTNMDSSENLIYEDSSYRVFCNVSDFRDTTWVGCYYNSY
ncbi:MAG: hypothetical protein K0Q56_599 [Sporolactobacillus laevolacticus]|nr:hypothetical protein [Sporolactobacillus laevolacticus]